MSWMMSTPTPGSSLEATHRAAVGHDSWGKGKSPPASVAVNGTVHVGLCAVGSVDVTIRPAPSIATQREIDGHDNWLNASARSASCGADHFSGRGRRCRRRRRETHQHHSGQQPHPESQPTALAAFHRAHHGFHLYRRKRRGQTKVTADPVSHEP